MESLLPIRLFKYANGFKLHLDQTLWRDLPLATIKIEKTILKLIYSWISSIIPIYLILLLIIIVSLCGMHMYLNACVSCYTWPYTEDNLQKSVLFFILGFQDDLSWHQAARPAESSLALKSIFPPSQRFFVAL